MKAPGTTLLLPPGSARWQGGEGGPLDPAAGATPAPASLPPDTLRAALSGLRVEPGAHVIPSRRYAPGDVLAERYRLTELLGQGSMGAVWRARNLGLDIDVALKLIRHDCALPDASARLLREAQAAAQVSHRAAVRVFDLGVTQAGEPFVVMELLDGKSLSRTLSEGGPMSPIKAVQILLPVIGALSAAHAAGVVHRDVKPANIMLVRDGRRTVPKLIDFGIAFAASRAAAGGGAEALVGSPAYMAPEQIRGQHAPDARTDVWSACVALYEMVSGTRPFGGPDSISIVHDVLRLDPPLTDVFETHPRLWEIVTRGLQKSPEARFPTMAALGRALAQWAITRGIAHDVMGTSLVDYWLISS